MIRIDQDDLRAVIEEMVEHAAAGEIVVLTRYGIAVAQLEAVTADEQGFTK